MAPAVAAYLFSYAEFALPICLLLGFATRFAALGPARPDDAAASLRRARDVVVVACLLGVDSDGPGVVRSGRHLHRRIDPHHLPAGSAAGPRLSALVAERLPTASSGCAAATSRERRHELCKRQRSRDRAGNPCGHCPGERRRRAGLRPRWLDQTGRADIRRDLSARGRGLPGADRNRGERPRARAPHAALGRRALP